MQARHAATTRATAAEHAALAAELKTLEAGARAAEGAAAEATAREEELRDEVSSLRERSARQQAEGVELQRSLEAHAAERAAQEGERLYLRNVIKRYMETEQHEARQPRLCALPLTRPVRVCQPTPECARVHRRSSP